MTLWIAVRATTVTVAAVLGTTAAVGFGVHPQSVQAPQAPIVGSAENTETQPPDDAAPTSADPDPADETDPTPPVAAPAHVNPVKPTPRRAPARPPARAVVPQHLQARIPRGPSPPAALHNTDSVNKKKDSKQKESKKKKESKKN
jgi:hypothetical protein